MLLEAEICCGELINLRVKNSCQLADDLNPSQQNNKKKKINEMFIAPGVVGPRLGANRKN